MSVVYIAGYSRSGSTILSLLLGAHPDVLALGEVSNLVRDWQDARLACTCGEPYCACPFWGDMPGAYAFTPELVRRLERVESREALPGLIAGTLKPADTRVYGDFARALFGYAQARSGRSVLVDSSKSARWAAGRALALHRYGDRPICVVHLVRGAAATVDSFIRKGSNWALEGRHPERRLRGLRSATGWYLANRAVLEMRPYLPPERFIRLGYDELVADPAAAVQRICAVVGLDPLPILHRLRTAEPLVAGHDVGGNRARLQPQTLQRTAAAPVLPWPHHHMAAALERRIGCSA